MGRGGLSRQREAVPLRAAIDDVRFLVVRSEGTLVVHHPGQHVSLTVTTPARPLPRPSARELEASAHLPASGDLVAFRTAAAALHRALVAPPSDPRMRRGGITAWPPRICEVSVREGTALPEWRPEDGVTLVRRFRVIRDVPAEAAFGPHGALVERLVTQVMTGPWLDRRRQRPGTAVIETLLREHLAELRRGLPGSRGSSRVGLGANFVRANELTPPAPARVPEDQSWHLAMSNMGHPVSSDHDRVAFSASCAAQHATKLLVEGAVGDGLFGGLRHVERSAPHEHERILKWLLGGQAAWLSVFGDAQRGPFAPLVDLLARGVIPLGMSEAHTFLYYLRPRAR